MRTAAAVLLAAGVTLAPAQAHAYRPFDGTDADVAELGTFELELGPAQWHYRSGQSGAAHYVVAPSTVLNFGLLDRTELVVDFDDYVALGPLAGRPRVALLDTDLKVKRLLREGTVQGKTGPSVAFEAGPLVPEVEGSSSWGASLDTLVSYEWQGGAVHLDVWPSYTREHEPDLFVGAIVEGPRRWIVRPVCEIFYEKELDVAETESALVGAIWEAKSWLALDAGIRGAHVGADHVAEARLGFTWTLSMWEAR